jgi:hypothetical protein
VTRAGNQQRPCAEYHQEDHVHIDRRDSHRQRRQRRRRPGAKIVVTARRAAALDEAAGDRRNIFATVADAVSPEDAVRSA